MLRFNCFLLDTLDGCRQGIQYDGDVSYSQSGKHCINWQALQLEAFGIDRFPDASWQDLGNKCR